MEVMTPVNFKEVLQKKLHGISKQYFSYGTSLKDQDFALNEPKSRSLHVEKGKTVKVTPTNRKQTHFLIAWGCGEFGQHGQDVKEDVTFEMALNELRGGELMIPDGEFPLNSVCGSSHTLVLTGAGQLYSWGNGTSGQLGNGTCLTTIKPMLVPLTLDGKIQGMACGARHSFIWTNTGYCYSFGNNFNAQLGYNFSKADFKENQLQPVLVELFPHMKVKEVACGARHSLFLLATGCVMAVGCNQHGQIGNATTDDAVIPTMVDDLNSITHVACGNIHSLVSHVCGGVFAWGYGKAFGSKARIVSTPQSFTPEDIENSSVVSLAGGDCHSMILYDCGIVYTWGNNYEGQLGVDKIIKYQNKPEPIPGQFLPRPVVQIACSETTSAAVTGTGKLYMWGKNAGLIYSDKPSQYFQYVPYHMDMDDWTVTQVSCGAWHVSAIVEKPMSELENSLENVHAESYEKDQLHSADLKENLVEVKLPCHDCRDDNLMKQLKQGDHTNRNEQLDVNRNLLDGSCSQSDVPIENGGCNVPELTESLLDICFITKYRLGSEISRTNIAEGCDAETEDPHLVKHFEEHSNQSEQNSFIQRTDNSSTKAVHVNNEKSFAKNKDSTFSCNEQSGFSESHKNHEIENNDSCIIEEGTDNINPEEKHVSVCQENDLIFGNEKSATLSNTPPRVYTMEFEKEHKIALGTSKTKTDKCLANKYECNRNNLNADPLVGSTLESNEVEEKDCLHTCCKMIKEKGNNFLVYIKGNQNRNNCAQNYFNRNRNCKKDDQFQSNDREFEVPGIETKKSNKISREEAACRNDIKQWDNSQSFYDWQEYHDSITASLSAKNPDSIAKRNVPGFSSDSHDEHMTTIRQNSRVRMNRDMRLALSPLQNSLMKPCSRRQAQSKATNSRYNDCIDELASRPQTVPVIDLSFGKTAGNAEQGIIKPRYAAFKILWKDSDLLSEKQKRFSKEGKGSDAYLGFNKGSQWPSRSNFAIKKIRERSMVSNDSTEKMKKKNERLMKCCHHTGDLLPPICSCKKIVQ